jgi:signal peptidase I
MEPTLRDGDWLLVDAEAYRSRAPRPGDLVVANGSGGLLVKRVIASTADGTLELGGDASSSGGHRHEARVPLSAADGRPWFRYWPPGRIGRVR